jgi:hypothetical protein
MQTTAKSQSHIALVNQKGRRVCGGLLELTIFCSKQGYPESLRHTSIQYLPEALIA